ncbi:hypothetical protein BGZ63DRAFT_78025 [Mariannaea sp. PMI_226]|nr:hypothetical protein BGZ63DRAFT_78025 [Mariannaea sp. PMI_226]
MQTKDDSWCSNKKVPAAQIRIVRSSLKQSQISYIRIHHRSTRSSHQEAQYLHTEYCRFTILTLLERLTPRARGSLLVYLIVIPTHNPLFPFNLCSLLAMASSSPKRLLDLIAYVDNVPLNFEADCHPYYRLYLAPDPRPHGYVHPDTIARMPWPASFSIDHKEQTVTLAAPPQGSSNFSAYANASFQEAIDSAIDKDIFPILHQEHSEPFRIVGAREPVQLERFAAPLFGIACRGAHLTGYVRAPDGSIQIWVARRSKSLFTYPGMLDSTVAGGIKASHSPLDCILAEAMEEACLPEELVKSQVRAVGAVTMANRNPRNGLMHSDIIYVYDLELPADVVPTPGDDEVETFILMGCEEVRQRMLAGEFKPNVCPVMIDFMVRHGELTAESEQDYAEICQRLKRRIPVPTTPE